MATARKIESSALLIKAAWLPCEYMRFRDGYKLLSIADIEADIYASDKQPDALRSAVEEFFEALSDDRKLVILVPNENPDQSSWPCKQLLKRDLDQTVESC